eukprot:TRINITY_DN2094_c0_g1_i2.p1 TRINITY_DN2094_c0_g1~~TRINITY_DN2094_c0_g1_i2.p1  ORF type:complete len:1432 (+),score=272.04 TRINITY_DN2094_c0_g1_i2:149-4444(+)
MVAVAATFAAVCAAVELSHRSTLLVLQETAEGDVAAASVRPSRHPVDIDAASCGSQTQVGPHSASISHRIVHRYLLRYRSATFASGFDCTQALVGPSGRGVERSCWREGSTAAGVVRGASDVFAVHLPTDVDVVDVLLANGTGGWRRRVEVAAAGRVAAALQQQQHGTPEFITEVGQTAAPTNTTTGGGSLSVVFLSAGYKEKRAHASARDRFISNVRTCLQYLQFPGSYGIAGGELPLSRYFSTFNVFAVFQESAGEGASKPAAGIQVNSNLQCSYGKGTASSPARALTCARADVVAMADVAPVAASSRNTLIVVLVSDSEYGGTGVHREGVAKYATLYTGAMDSGRAADQRDAASLLFHELMHAHSDLADEYNTGLFEADGYNCEPVTAATVADDGEWGYAAKRAAPAGVTGICEKNCAFRAGDELPWADWKASRLGTTALGVVDETPQQGCYFSNWYRPGTGSDSKCLMEQLGASGLCPVCREAAVLQLYTDGMDLTYPACPHPYWTETVLAQAGEGSRATFFANDRLFGSTSGVGQADFHVRWLVDSAAQSDATSYLTVDAAARGLLIGVHKVSLVIEDASPWVLSARKPPTMRQTVIEWNVRVLADKAAVEAYLTSHAVPSDKMIDECSNRGSFFQNLQPEAVAGYPVDSTLAGPQNFNPYLHYRRCVGVASVSGNCTCGGRGSCTCMPDSTGQDMQCALGYNARRYEAPTDLSDITSDRQAWLVGMGCGFVGGTLLLVACVQWYMLRRYGRTPSRAVEDIFTLPIRWARRIMLASAAAFALLAVGGITGTAVFYAQVGAVAQVGLLTAMAFFMCMFVLALTGFLAVYYATMPLLQMNQIALIFASFGTLVFAGVLYFAGYGANDTGGRVQESFKEQWERAVKSSPSLLCSAQALFECSGWEVSCHQFQSPSNCPVNCELTNERYSDTCKVEVLSFIHKWFPISGSLFMALCYVLLIGCILNYLLYLAMQRSDALNGKKMELLMRGPIQSILKIVQLSRGGGSKFVDKATQEFTKVDLDGSGELDKAEFKFFFRRLMGITDGLESKMSDEDTALFEEKLDAVFELLDLDGSGRISLKEWLEVLDMAAGVGQEPVLSEYVERGLSAEEWEEAHSKWSNSAEQFRLHIDDRNRSQEEKMEGRRKRRLQQIARSLDGNLPLEGLPEAEPHPHEDQVLHDAWRLLGTLSDKQWDQVVWGFNDLAVSDSGKVRFIFTDQPASDKPSGYRQWLEHRYGEAVRRLEIPRSAGVTRKRLRQVIDELPRRMDKDGNGQVDCVEWLAAFYVRSRDLEMLEWVRTYAESVREKQLRRKATKRHEKEEADLATELSRRESVGGFSRRGSGWGASRAGSVTLGMHRRGSASSSAMLSRRRSSSLGRRRSRRGSVSGAAAAATEEMPGPATTDFLPPPAPIASPRALQSSPRAGLQAGDV